MPRGAVTAGCSVVCISSRNFVSACGDARRGGILKKSVVAVLTALAAPLALAQDPEQEVVVTAARLPRPLSQTLQPVAIITAEDIAKAGQQTLVEVLQALGGVEIASNGGFGQPSSVFMRGANSTHTLVLVDGMRIGSATLGSTALENIPLNQIERIEVVPGQLSSLYGSDAVGGVIQIFTKSGKSAPSGSVTAGAGTDSTISATAGVSRAIGSMDFSLNVGYFGSDGFDATKPGAFGHAPDKDGYRNQNFSGKIAYHLDARNELGLTVFQSDGYTHLDNDPTIDAVTHQTLSAFSVYSSNQITDAWQSLLRAGQGQDKSTTTGAFPSVFTTRQPQYTWQNNIKIGPGTAIAGAEYLVQDVTSDSTFAQNQRTIKSGFAGYLGAYGKNDWQANVRVDDNSQFGSHTTGLLGYAYRPTEELRFRVGAGTAFKAPDFNNLYLVDPTGSFTPNPNLRPEVSRSKEAGVNYQTGASRFSATYFDNHIDDLIIFVVTVPATFAGTVQNVDNARIRGVELGYQGSFASLQAYARVTLQNPEDEATGSMLPRRAKEFAGAGLSNTSGSWTLGGEVVASSARFDQAGEVETSKMHGYALLNLTATYAIDREWSVRARWNNVFNREYELAQHFNTPGTNVFLALQYQSK
jgi:vitamin B12 transporter